MFELKRIAIGDQRMTKAATKGRPMTGVQRKRLRVMMERLGPAAAAAALGVSRGTLDRAAGGMPLYRSSRTAIEAGLAVGAF